jgi:hypothetical protein
MMVGYHEGAVHHPPLAAGSIPRAGYEIVEHLHQSKNFDVYYVFARSGPAAASPRRPGRTFSGARRCVAVSFAREGSSRSSRTRTSCGLYEIVKEPHPALILETLTGETLSHIIDTGYRRLPLLSVVYLGCISARPSTTSTPTASCIWTSSPPT